MADQVRIYAGDHGFKRSRWTGTRGFPSGKAPLMRFRCHRAAHAARSACPLRAADGTRTVPARWNGTARRSLGCGRLPATCLSSAGNAAWQYRSSSGKTPRRSPSGWTGFRRFPSAGLRPALCSCATRGYPGNMPNVTPGRTAGTFAIKNSTNGTFAGGMRIRDRRLRDGDTVFDRPLRPGLFRRHAAHYRRRGDHRRPSAGTGRRARKRAAALPPPGPTPFLRVPRGCCGRLPAPSLRLRRPPASAERRRSTGFRSCCLPEGRWLLPWC